MIPSRAKRHVSILLLSLAFALPAEAAKPKILMVVTSHDQFGSTGKKTGYWLGEVAHFHQVATAEGFDVDFVSPKGGKPPMDERSRDDGDSLNRAFLQDAAAVAELDASLTPIQVKATDYVAIYFAGGHGPMWDLPENAELQAIARAIYESGGIVAAVCHGPAGLLNLKLSDGSHLLQGKRVTGLSNFEEWLSGHKSDVPFLLEDELEKRGAKFCSGIPFLSQIEVDGRLITGRNPNSTEALARATVKALKDL